MHTLILVAYVNICFGFRKLGSSYQELYQDRILKCFLSLKFVCTCKLLCIVIIGTSPLCAKTLILQITSLRCTQHYFLQSSKLRPSEVLQKGAENKDNHLQIEEKKPITFQLEKRGLSLIYSALPVSSQVQCIVQCIAISAMFA